jgi:hypothetical protein
MVMAGSKTRFGFVGNGEEPPHEDESRSARTIIGRDIHLQLPTGIAPPNDLGSPTPLPPVPQVRPPLPRTPAMAPMAEEVTKPIPARRSRPRGSHLARFLGRWTESGRFESSSRMNDSSHARALDDEDFRVPRDSTGRNFLLVLIAAVLAFAITFALVKLRQRYASQGQPEKHLVEASPVDQKVTHAGPAESPSAPTQATAPMQAIVPTQAMVPTQATVKTPPAAEVPLAPFRAPIHAPAPANGVPSTHRTATVGLAASPKVAPHQKKPQQLGSGPAEPPDHLKRELLPITP